MTRVKQTHSYDKSSQQYVYMSPHTFGLSQIFIVYPFLVQRIFQLSTAKGVKWWRYIKKQVTYSCHHHHQLNVHFLPRSIKSMDGCFPTALGRQSTILKAAVYPWESWSEFWWRDALPHTNQLGLGKRRWNLEDLFSGSWISASVYRAEENSGSHRMNFRKYVMFQELQIPAWWVKKRPRGNHREEIETGRKTATKEKVNKTEGEIK